MPFSYQNLSEQNNERVNQILEVIMSYARLDFSKKTDVTGRGDVLDAISAGVNMLGEELEASTTSLKEKEQHLKEIHHRVKNNLQIVSSLLNLQSYNVADKNYQTMISDSRNRIHSIALVHEMLYSSPNLSKIAINDYITFLSESIRRSFESPGFNIEFYYTIEPNLFFDIDRMIPLGLILNEVINNSMKHAFPNAIGQIHISLCRLGKEYSLIVRDNGIGFPENFDPGKDAHFGMQLIHMLTEQMSGRIEINQKNGTSYNIIFA